MTKSKQKVAVGVFESRAEADRAVEELERAGFRRDQIGVAARNADGSAKETSKGDAELENAGTGLAAGAAAGAGIGGLIGLGVVAGVVPVIGPAIAAGTLGVILSNAAGGAAIAGLTGALIGWGMTKEDAAFYESEMKAGRYLVTVHTDDRFEEAWRILHIHGAYNRQTPRAATTSTAGQRASSSSRTSNQETMKLHEEHLNVQKQPVNTGEVRVRKEVVTDHKTIDVPVQREEVVIERQRVSGGASSSEIRPGEEIRIPVKEDQVRVNKEAVVNEEVRVGKRQVQDTERVSGDVRREEVKVEQTGKVDVRDADKGSSTGRKNK